MKVVTLGWIGLAAALALPVQADTRLWEKQNDNSSAFIGLGSGEGEANELVYCQPVSGCPTDYKLSQLIWKTRDIPMLSGGISHQIDRDWAFNLKGRVSLTEGDAVMDDYDWKYTNLGWSHWSHHEDTDVSTAWAWDASLDYTLYDQRKFWLDLVAGYRQETWGWDSYGGFYIYSDTDSGGFRDLSGSFTPGTPAISYEQRHKLPYIGLNVGSHIGPIDVGVKFEYSDWVDVEATDIHHMRDLRFEDRFETGSMTAYEFSMGHQFSDETSVIFSYEKRKYDEVRGGSTTYDITTGAIDSQCTNCSGADNESTLWTLALSRQF